MSLLYEFSAERFVADISGDTIRLATRRLDEFYDFFGVSLFARQVIDDNIRSFAGESNGRGSSDSGVAPKSPELCGSEDARFRDKIPRRGQVSVASSVRSRECVGVDARISEEGTASSDPAAYNDRP